MNCIVSVYLHSVICIFQLDWCRSQQYLSVVLDKKHLNLEVVNLMLRYLFLFLKVATINNYFALNKLY